MLYARLGKSWRIWTKDANQPAWYNYNPEPRTINIQVWDLNNVTLIDSAIKKSELGLNPQVDGQ